MTETTIAMTAAMRQVTSAGTAQRISTRASLSRLKSHLGFVTQSVKTAPAVTTQRYKNRNEQTRVGIVRVRMQGSARASLEYSELCLMAVRQTNRTKWIAASVNRLLREPESNMSGCLLQETRRQVRRWEARPSSKSFATNQ